MSINYLFRVQVRHGFGRHWTTKYACESMSQAYLLYRGINLGNGWHKRLISRRDIMEYEES